MLLTVVIVARPLAPGEDAGQTSDFAEPAGMILTFLALVGLAGWAAWRARSGQRAVYAGLAEAALASLAVAYIATISRASYTRPALFTAFEWVGLFVTFFLTRQLSARGEERQAIFAVLAASLLGLAVDAGYQQLRVLPAQADAVRKEQVAYDKFVEDAQNRLGRSPTPTEIHLLARQVERSQSTGPYVRATSLATVLVLLVPALVGCLVVSVRSGASTGQTVGAAVFTLVAAAALASTGVREAMVVLIASAVALGVALVVRKSLVVSLIAFAVVLGGLLSGAYSAGLLGEAASLRREVWPATTRLIGQNVWLGYGPGQFGLFYPRHLDPTASIKPTDPFSGALEVLADTGTLGGVFLALAVLTLFVAVRRGWPAAFVRKPEAAPPAVAPPAPNQPLPRWEFYAGGMVGLVLGFILRAGLVAPDEVVAEAIVAGVRSIVWFVAFAALENVDWTENEYAVALAGGVVPAGVLLLAGSGLTFAAVAVPVWVAAALLLSVCVPSPNLWLSRNDAVGFMVIPASLAVAFAFFALAFYPAAASQAALRKTQMAGGFYFQQMQKPSAERTLRDPIKYIRDNFIAPLERARADDGANARLMVELSAWYGQLWAMGPDDDSPTGPGRKSFAFATQVQSKINPEGSDGYIAEFEMHTRISTMLRISADAFEKQAKEAKDAKKTDEAARISEAVAQRRQAARDSYGRAAEAINRYVPRDPSDPLIHHRRLAALVEAGRMEGIKELAAKVIELDDLSRRPDEVGEPKRTPRSLSDRQRSQAEKWLSGESRK